MLRRRLLGLALGGIAAQATAIAAAPVAQFQATECVVILEQRGDAASGAALRLRPTCPIGFDSTRLALDALLARLPAGTPEASLQFGRAIEYPWLSSLIARRAAGSGEWNGGTGSAARKHDNRTVAQLLARAPDFAQLFPGWRVGAVSVEKVLVRPARELHLPGKPAVSPEAMLPYDAQVWVRLRR